MAVINKCFITTRLGTRRWRVSELVPPVVVQVARASRWHLPPATLATAFLIAAPHEGAITLKSQVCHATPRTNGKFGQAFDIKATPIIGNNYLVGIYWKFYNYDADNYFSFHAVFLVIVFVYLLLIFFVLCLFKVGALSVYPIGARNVL